jgi:hypothetical protein
LLGKLDRQRRQHTAGEASLNTNKSHRDSASEARTAAAASDLPNVRDRHLRSADAHDAAASRQETTAARLKVRQADAAERKAAGVDVDDDENDDGGEMD